MGKPSCLACLLASTLAVITLPAQPETWTTTGSLHTTRSHHTATLLADGRVLVAGGRRLFASGETASAELYDPATGKWTPTESLNTARDSHTATLLADGRVLIAGGASNFFGSASAELYDPATGTWALTASLGAARHLHTASLLADDRVLVTGGFRGVTLASAEVYDYVRFLLYPQLALGGGFEVVFLVTNQGRKEWRGRALLDAGDWPAARPWSLNGLDRTGQSGFDIQLEPNQTKKFILSSNGPVVSGWLEIRGKPRIADLATTFFYNFFAGAELGDSTGVGVAPAVTAVTFPVERSAQINTGIALRQTQARVNLRLYDEAGVSLGAGRRGREGARFVDELFGVPENFVGSLRAESSRPFHLGVLRQEVIPGTDLRFQLTSVPTTPVPFLVKEGAVALATLAGDGGALPDTWVKTGSLNLSRSDHTATLLEDGRVLVAGGLAFSPTANTERYDPTSGGWQPVANLNTAREDHTATRLSGDFVLVAGGRNDQGTTAACERFNPLRDNWLETGNLNTARDSHSATRLSDGRVLVAGGYAADGRPTATAEIYDPSSGAWSATVGLPFALRSHTATRLADGRVLVVGGAGDRRVLGGTGILAVADLYDPESGRWSSASPLETARLEHSATLLANGRVLVAGGLDSGISPTATVELYDPVAGEWTTVGSLNVARSFHSASLLADGRVLVTGGFGATMEIPGAEIYDPTTRRWTLTGNLNTARRSHTANVLQDGRVLIAGGVQTGIALGSAELYDYRQLLFPQLALGGGFDVIFMATNQSTRRWVGVAELDSGAWPGDRTWALDGTDRTGRSAFEIRLGPNQTHKYSLTRPGQPVVSGWLEIKSARLDELATSFFYNFFSSPTTAFGRRMFEDSTGVGAVPPVTAVRFPVERSSSVNTGLAIRQFGNVLGGFGQGQISFTLYDQAGNLLGTVTDNLNGGRFFDEIFPGVAQNFLGSLKVESVKPFYLTVLRQELIPGPQLRFQLTSVPATPVP